MSQTAINTSYEPFSREPEYLDLNRAFIRSLCLKRPRYLCDLACGTGTLTGLILEEQFGNSPAADICVVGIDISRESLSLGRNDLARFCSEGTVQFIEASAENIPVREGWADLVVIGNAIHYFADKETLFRNIRRTLRPAGLLAFNSSFYAGTFPRGTERFYTEWLKQALTFLQRQRGQPHSGRVKGAGKAAFSQKWLMASEYVDLLEKASFTVQSVYERTIQMSRSNFETVGAYEGLATVLLSGFPAVHAAEALVAAVGPALEAVGMPAVPRNWLEISAAAC